MSRIIIDGRMLGWTGIGRYTYQLLSQLEQLDATNNYLVMVQRRDWGLWEPTKPNFKRVEVNIEPYSLAEQWRLPWALRKLRPDLVHFLNFNSPLCYFGRWVVTIHDLTLLDYKNYRGRGWHILIYNIKYRAMLAVFKKVVTKATQIITDTIYNKQELIGRGYAQGDRITPIHLGVPPLPSTSKTTTERQPYLLYVGNLYPYKNLVSVVKALPELIHHHPSLRLVIVGNEDAFSQGIRRAARRLGVEQAVAFTGFIGDMELAQFYQGAAVYVFPSLSEGFGLPGLEAMGYGVPVAASQASCLPEVYGNAAAYFDPSNPHDIARVLAELLDNKQQREQLVAAGFKRLKHFSWERMAEQTLDVYRQALGE